MLTFRPCFCPFDWIFCPFFSLAWLHLPEAARLTRSVEIRREKVRYILCFRCTLLGQIFCDVIKRIPTYLMKIVKVSADFSTKGPGCWLCSAGAGGLGEAGSGQCVNSGQHRAQLLNETLNKTLHCEFYFHIYQPFWFVYKLPNISYFVNESD